MTIETVKLINDKGDIIERYKHDYENNKERFKMRGWSLKDDKAEKPKTAKPVKEVKKVVKKVTKKVTKKKKTKK